MPRLQLIAALMVLPLTLAFAADQEAFEQAIQAGPVFQAQLALVRTEMASGD